MIGKTNSNFQTIEVVENYGYKIVTEYETDDNGNQIQILNIYDWDYASGQDFNKVFANNTPAQISKVSEEISKNGYTSEQVSAIYGWNINDAISVTLTNNEIIEMRIIGFNHDTLSSDHTSKVGITLGMENCLATNYTMNSEATNAGGYPATEMRTSTLPTIKALLPQEWQDVIKLVDKKSANGGSTNYTETVTTSEDLFLFSIKEVLGNGSGAQDGENEGEWYEGFNSVDSRIKKRDSDADGIPDMTCQWWTRSCNANGAQFRMIMPSGTSFYSNANTARYVSFGFCV